MSVLFESAFWAVEGSSGLGMVGKSTAILLSSVDKHVKLNRPVIKDVATQRNARGYNYPVQLFRKIIIQFHPGHPYPLWSPNSSVSVFLEMR